jgi:hypothetical protein
MFDQNTMDQLATAVAARIIQSLPKPGVAQRWLTVAQAAEYIGHTKKSFEYLLTKALFPVVRNDRLVLIDKNDLDTFLLNSKT